MSESDQIKTVMMMAGGTGGHIFPALCLAQALSQSGIKVQWLGSQVGMEKRLVGDQYPMHLIAVRGLRGRGLLAKLFAPVRILTAIYQAYQVLRKVRPQVVIGMGGFASGPGGVAARVLRIPLIIHEQNARAGLTNRLLARISQHVFQAYPHAFAESIKAQTIGNPLRQSIIEVSPPAQRYQQHQGALRVLILGGSQGAQAINALLIDTLKQFNKLSGLTIRHQVGQANLENLQQAYKALACDANVVAFIDDMAAAYAWADLVICRAGALTVAEVAAVGVASLMIPYPFAVDDHQWHNAQFLAQADAALLFRQTDLTTQSLAQLLQTYLVNRNALLEMANKARALAQIDANHTIVQAVMECLNDHER